MKAALKKKRKNYILYGILTACFLFILALNGVEFLTPVKYFLEEQISFTFKGFHISAYFLMKAAILIIFFIVFINATKRTIEKQIKKISGISKSNKLILIKILRFLSYGILILITLDVLGINLTGLAVFSGAIGIGLGFGLQKITANFISGLILLFEKSIESGDLIELADGTFGFVLETSSRFTVLEGMDGKEIMIPNEEFINNRVINWTFTNTRARISIVVGVSYSSDLKKVKELILEAAAAHPRCMQDPPPSCFLTEFADNSVNFLLLVWVSDVLGGRYGPKSEIMFSIWDKFKENNIEIPFPQRDVHIKQMPQTLSEHSK